MTDANKITAIMADGRPRTASELAERIGSSTQKVVRAMKDHPEAFEATWNSSVNIWEYRMKPAAAAAIKEGTV